ncbi:uncharacterized protein C19orf44 homolog [Stegostoma tigrinum]|uniref:uncharacterized protein C19orf44 homolog n=1 Tax=Stegostoma tigrinum TaxID=3053191 RepID=UPI00202ADA4A|nr:uncharacterized protein C19orf44 homolog [Stegostoma tigrinum]XP_048415466.1 uncharacterized protein C19orf44 homolog [Stegostoma tigrinum]XP_048415467.1 uncharacterized protein C19orf44 homolog [Stegostoma tigrinum]XP_048415468.1 uncharacterized protein C19orf44 homolog [Stegostoma tigrinum]
MFRRSGLGSSALARAQAQLSGQRISGIFEDSGDELREYMSALYKKNNTLRVNPFNLHEISDLSDFSTEDTVDKEWKENQYSKTAATVMPVEGIRELTLTGSRFLKKPNKLAVSQSPTMSKSVLKKANEMNTRKPSTASVLSRSSSAALARLAQIESRIMNRRLNAHTIDSDEYLCSSDEKQISPKSSSELSGKGSRFLKRTANTATKQETNVRDLKKEIGSSKKNQQNGHPRSPGKVVMVNSDEEEVKMLGGSFKLTDESELTKQSHKTAQHGSKLHNQSIMRNHQRSPLRMPSPPSVGTPLSQSPRMKFVKRRPFSPSEQSEIKSLDELFTEPSVADDLKNLDSESSNDFRLNILTLEDLVPTVEQKMKKEAPTLKNEENQLSDDQTIQSTFCTTRLHMADEPASPDTQPSTLSREKDASDLESDIMTESAGSEITEHLSRKEKHFPEKLQEQLKTDDESTLCSEYSEDFENSDSEGASVKRDQSESCAERSSKEDLKTDYSDNSPFHSTSSTPSPTPDQSKSTASSESLYSLEKKEVSGLTKVTVRDTAIQTQPSGMAYTWSKEEGVAVLGTSLGATYVDPTPIASHVISPDAMEALTAYSPASFALNDMLKQQLSLIRQFVQVSRHLYLSVVASIEQDNYHYTTLEEAKEFIRSHRSPPLTLDEALEEVRQEMKQYHCI